MLIGEQQIWRILKEFENNIYNRNNEFKGRLSFIVMYVTFLFGCLRRLCCLKIWKKATMKRFPLRSVILRQKMYPHRIMSSFIIRMLKGLNFLRNRGSQFSKMSASSIATPCFCDNNYTTPPPTTTTDTPYPLHRLKLYWN